MKSIKSKLLAIYIIFIIITVGVVTGVSVMSINTLSMKDSDQILVHMGREHANHINGRLQSVERSVNNMQYYAYDQLEALFGKLFGAAFRKDYLSKVELLALNQANSLYGVESVYYRLTTDIQGDDIGFYYIRDKGSGEFIPHDFSIFEEYSKDDLEHYGWFFKPMEEKRPLWIGPYSSVLFSERLMSYVYPVYVYGRFAGVVGIDINIEALCDEVSQIRLYDTGSAILFDEKGNIIFDKVHTKGIQRDYFSDEEATVHYATHLSLDADGPIEYISDTGVKKLYATKLINGMTLAVTAPSSEINSTMNSVLIYSILIGVLVCALSTVALILLLRNFLRPMSDLMKASEELSNGNFDVPMFAESNDEMGRLAKTFGLMANSLKKYYEHFHSLAYTDAMTGLNNKAAFTIRKEVIESEIKMGLARFDLVVMDINDLKQVNDKFGHEKGDHLIKHVSECLRETFVGFPLYRIGGDVFCAVTSDADIHHLIDRLQITVAKRSERDMDLFDGIRYQIAAGGASYRRGSDISFDEVYNRAEEAMNENKKMLKGIRD